MKTKPHEPNLDTDLPALIPEIIAGSVTPDPEAQAALCDRARVHWKGSAGFRRSFQRRDEREQLRVWMDHWHQARLIREAKGGDQAP